MNLKHEEPLPVRKIPWMDEALKLARATGFYGNQPKSVNDKIRKGNDEQKEER